MKKNLKLIGISIIGVCMVVYFSTILPNYIATGYSPIISHNKNDDNISTTIQGNNKVFSFGNTYLMKNGQKWTQTSHEYYFNNTGNGDVFIYKYDKCYNMVIKSLREVVQVDTAE